MACVRARGLAAASLSWCPGRAHSTCCPPPCLWLSRCSRCSPAATAKPLRAAAARRASSDACWHPACTPAVEVGEVTFKFPVEIGDLLRMRTLVLHTWTQPGDPAQGRAHLQVEASVTQPEKRQRWARRQRGNVHMGPATGRRTTVLTAWQQRALCPCRAAQRWHCWLLAQRAAARPASPVAAPSPTHSTLCLVLSWSAIGTTRPSRPSGCCQAQSARRLRWRACLGLALTGSILPARTDGNSRAPAPSVHRSLHCARPACG